MLKREGRDDQLRALLAKDDGKAHVPKLDYGMEERKEPAKQVGPAHQRQQPPVQSKVIPRYNEFAN